MILNLKTIDVNGTDYVIAENFCGERKAKADLFFIHGIGGNYREFLPLINLFGNDYNIVSINLPGFGKSEPLREFSVEKLVRDISELISQFTDNKAVLIGHSLGGVLGYIIASKNTEVKKLVVLNSPIKRAHIPKPSIDYVDVFAKLGNNDPLTNVITSLKNSKLGYDFIDKVVANYLDKGVGVMNKAYKYNYAAEAVAEANAKAATEYAKLLANLDISTEIIGLKTPTLSLFGLDDKNVIPQTAEYLKSINPNVQTVMLDKLDHGGLMTQPERVFESIIKFIE